MKQIKKQHEKPVRHVVLVSEQLKSQKETRQRIMAGAIYKDTVIKKFSKWKKSKWWNISNYRIKNLYIF